MIEEIEKIELKEKEERKTKGRRMMIEDVDGTEDEPLEEEKPEISESPAEKKQPRRMQIQEVDSEEEEEEEEEGDNDKEGKGVPYPMVNGHASLSEKQEAESVMNNVSNKNEPVANDGYIKTPIETPLKTTVVDNLTDVNDKLKDIDTTASAQKSKLGDDRTGDGGTEHIHKEPADSKVLEEVKQEHFDDTKQIESNTVIENDWDKSTSKNCDSKEGDSDDMADAHVFKRPVLYKLAFPENCVSLREEANSCFRNGQYGDGCEKYSTLINILETGRMTVNLFYKTIHNFSA